MSYISQHQPVLVDRTLHGGRQFLTPEGSGEGSYRIGLYEEVSSKPSLIEKGNRSIHPP